MQPTGIPTLVAVLLMSSGPASGPAEAAEPAEPCSLEFRAPLLVPAADAVTVNTAWVQDHDGDGRPDIVGVMVLGDEMKHAILLRNLGGRAFETVVGPQLGQSFNDVRLHAADLDGDGTMDLAAGSSTSIDFLRGLGSFQFELASELSMVLSASWFLADLDGDGPPDLIATARDSVRAWHNEGSFAFAGPRDIVIQGFEDGVAVADVDADGRPDVVVGVNGGIAILPGAEDFTDPLHVSIPGRDAFWLADLDADELPEIIVTSSRDNAPTVHPNLGGLEFGVPRTIDLPVRASDLSAGDLDGDGRVEIVAACQSGLMVVEGPLAAEPSVTRRDLGVTFSTASVADMDGDGRNDVFARVTVLPEVGAILFGGVPPRDPVRVEGFYDSRGAAIADLDRDGRQDLANAVHGAQSIRIWRGAGDGTLAEPFDVGTTGDPRGLAAADFDADGWVDLAVSTNGAFVGVAILRNLRGRGFERLPLPGEFTEAEALAAADIDGDGAQDLAVRHKFAGASVLFNDGDGAFPMRKALEGELGGGVVIADADGDGREDVLVPAYPGVYIHYGEEGRVFSRYLVSAPETVACAAGDLTGDGVPELVVAHAGAQSRVSFFQGLGRRRFGLGWDLRYPDLRDPAGVVMGNLAGDAWTDFVLVRDDSDFVTVFSNGGGGEFDERRYACKGRAVSALIGDMDGNHRDDIVLIAESSATIFENLSPCAPALRGDVDLDRRLIVTDAVDILRYLFWKQPLDCTAAGDADSDGTIGVSDTTTILRHLFLGETMARDPVTCRG